MLLTEPKPIWIPPHIAKREDLCLSEKRLLSLIEFCDTKDGFFMSNKCLELRLKITERSIRRAIEKLKKLGDIKETSKGSRNQRRILKPTLRRPPERPVRRPGSIYKTGGYKDYRNINKEEAIYISQNNLSSPSGETFEQKMEHYRRQAAEFKERDEQNRSPNQPKEVTP